MLTEEKVLIKLSLMLSLVGIGILVLMQRSETTPIVPIDAITEGLLNKEVTIAGTVSYVKEMPSIEILKVKNNNSTIDVVVFRSDTLDVKKGDNVEIEGLVNKYKENLQIEAKTIRVV